MRILVHIGPEHAVANWFGQALAQNQDQLIKSGILVPNCFSADGPPRLAMAVSDPDHIDPHRYRHDVLTRANQQDLAQKLGEELAAELAGTTPRLLVLFAPQLGSTLHRASELTRLKDWLTQFSDDIQILAHVDDPARALTRHYASQIMNGRIAPLNRDIDLMSEPDWWQAARDAAPQNDPPSAMFAETQAPPFWLDYTAFTAFWESAFGNGSVMLRRFDPDQFTPDTAAGEIRACIDADVPITVDPPDNLTPPPAAWLARARQLNELLHKITGSRRRSIPQPLWREFLEELHIDGPAIDPGTLSFVSDRFKTPPIPPGADQTASETVDHPRNAPAKLWTEADPKNGYRASQYLLSFMYRIDKATQAKGKPDSPSQPDTNPGSRPSSAARAIMPAQAIENLAKLRKSALAPHNSMGAVNEEQLAAAFTPIAPRTLPDGTTGTVIVGCMKDEAPYIVEWVAHHRAIGVDNFLIYTNDCSDGTVEILDRLQAMGVLQHVNNDNWRGKSPQQYALNQALRTPLIRQADWIIHIDVDEFMNIRTGNGTLVDFLAHVPDATNVAMTWRMFGHNGITELSERFVIDQFDRCAPKYCPKPHTVWGFKTMFRNIGAYEKISCHRPNKLDAALRDRVRWVNGSGHDMTGEVVDNGWRNSRKSIGYDLLQLNHYALRSAESFLIKRQRGRALHVDRSIGLNYWIRMDWSDVRDITIKRNLPRLRQEVDQLLADPVLRKHHDDGLAWHRARAAQLRETPEFQELLQNALRIRLTGTERVAYALALDMES